jgi:hypothetical protein
MSNRREFISKAATICLAGITAGKLTSLHADGHMVSESDANAKALGYVADASNAKGDKFKAGSNCSNCALFQGGQGDAGNCPLFGGKKVAAAGWCTAWAPK